jgi:SAM-dependent methyltransferase
VVYHLKHDMLAQQDAADVSRARFILSFKRHLTGRLRPQNGLAYEAEGVPAFREKHGYDPRDRGEAEEALFDSPQYQTWCTLQRTSQEMMWQNVAEAIFRDEERMRDQAANLLENRPAGGSLTLNPNIETDPYDGVEVHLQPLGYDTDDGSATDVKGGAFYEMGGRLYSMGRGMAAEDSKAECVIRHLAEAYPDFKPTRILEMGCSAGGAAASYAHAFPDAEVHAIDLGVSMLRYASARAEALGQRVHFHQMDAANTSFPDGHFDFVVSHNLFHEVSTATRQSVARESFRLLKPGGVAVHQDVDLLFRGKTLWQEAERAWDLKYNGEPFWVDYAECDFLSELEDAGFVRAHMSEAALHKTKGPGSWYAFVAQKV